jgi:hypothetical protein
MSSNASHGSHGWFEGMMDVILGMALRLSMPQPYATRPALAPNFPAHNAFANFPSINRMPLQDLLDHSIHNKLGHGKSTKQIVRDLKAFNAHLLAKLAAMMEAKFMNQLVLAANELKVKNCTKSIWDSMERRILPSFVGRESPGAPPHQHISKGRVERCH